MARIAAHSHLPDSTTLWDFFDRLRKAPASALLLDYDGTLAPFQVERNDAYPYPEVVPLLERILESGNTRIVIITGRPVADLKPFLSPLENLEIWGAHGMEHLLPDGTLRRTQIAPSMMELLAQAREWVIKSKLVPLAEFKPGGIAIHWRGMSEPEARNVDATAREGWTGLTNSRELKLLSFESGVELRVGHPDKGNAVSEIIGESSSLTEIAYLGDDLTDEDSFRALNGRGLTVLVRPNFRETAAQVWLRPPLELVGFLEQWLNGRPDLGQLTTAF